MELFMPSERILQEIGWDDEGQRIYVTHVADASESALRGTLYSIGSIITDVYKFQFKLIDLRDSLRPVLRLAWESLKNASVHGSKRGLPFTYGLFIARKGICHGFQDGDGYFSREDVKQWFESKTPLAEFDMGVSSRRVGVRKHIYKLSDIIEVDTTTGTLYCVQYFEGFIRLRNNR